MLKKISGYQCGHWQKYSQQLNLGLVFEIRTFLLARNYMISGYKMKFCSIPADSIILSNLAMFKWLVDRWVDKVRKY